MRVWKAPQYPLLRGKGNIQLYWCCPSGEISLSKAEAKCTKTRQDKVSSLLKAVGAKYRPKKGMPM